MPPVISRLDKTFIVLIIGAASAAANAGVYRCKDGNGQTTLSDRPCGAVFDGQHPDSKNAADRIAAPNMVSAQAKDIAAQYGFIGEHGARARPKASMNQEVK
ncbi:DUF4124 domain-containing protein [Variovorax sp. GT1P44]|uniref:DUF4124 domain-containing protein n=1 Tax=Variovorax sp. GT1P44 TaxID=3443742 RepID=UPI003F46E4A5